MSERELILQKLFDAMQVVNKLLTEAHNDGLSLQLVSTHLGDVLLYDVVFTAPIPEPNRAHEGF